MKGFLTSRLVPSGLMAAQQACAIDLAGRRRPLDEFCPGQAILAHLDEYCGATGPDLVELRRNIPNAPLVLQLEPEFDDLRLLPVASAAGARAVYRAERHSWTDVARTICSTEHLESDFVTWLRLLRAELEPRLIERVGTLVGTGKRGGNVRDAARQMAITSRALRKDFALARLPKPWDFVRFGRLAVAICACGNPGWAERAMTAGYAEANSLRRALNALSPQGLRLNRALGWEWLAWEMDLPALHNGWQELWTLP